MASETIFCGDYAMSEISISAGLRDGGKIDLIGVRRARTHAESCGLCRVTPLGHALLPLAGTLLAFVALVFGCR